MNEDYNNLTSNASLLLLLSEKDEQLREKDEQIKTMRADMELLKETRQVVVNALKQVTLLREDGIQRIAELAEQVAQLQQNIN